MCKIRPILCKNRMLSVLSGERAVRRSDTDSALSDAHLLCYRLVAYCRPLTRGLCDGHHWLARASSNRRHSSVI